MKPSVDSTCDRSGYNMPLSGCGKGGVKNGAGFRLFMLSNTEETLIEILNRD